MILFILSIAFLIVSVFILLTPVRTCSKTNTAFIKLISTKEFQNRML